MNGLHLLADWIVASPRMALMTHGDTLRNCCLEAINAAQFTIVGDKFHGFLDAKGASAGVTGTVLLAESHLAIHTWPERGVVTLDLYVCNQFGDHAAQAHQVLAQLQKAFGVDVEKAALQIIERSV
jgi:S-adenosylmethionine decarboxylase proenzyme